MGRHLPTPRTDADEYAAATVEVLSELRDLMRDVRDRLPAPPSIGEGDTVELREPAPFQSADSGPPQGEQGELKTLTSFGNAENEPSPSSSGAARPRRRSTNTKKGGSA